MSPHLKAVGSAMEVRFLKLIKEFVPKVPENNHLAPGPAATTFVATAGV